MTGEKNFEVIIIGGSYAGLSSAMTLGRSLRKTLVIDSGHPCNATTPHSHNFLTQDGKTPEEITKIARQQVEQYDQIHFKKDLAVKAIKTDEGFEVTTQSGEIFACKKLVFATGIKDKLPEIKGLSACWGISVIHCPYCHGYEFRNRRTGILANGDAAYHLAPLVNNLTDNLTILTNGKAVFSEEQLDKLRKHNIRIIEAEPVEIAHDKGQLEKVIFRDETRIALDALYAKIPFVQHTDLPVRLGCELTEAGYIKVDNLQKTSVPGVFACGDNSNFMRSVANAVSSGNFTGAVINKELTDESF